MKKILSYIALFLCMGNAQAQNITQMEYWVDVDSGFGQGINISGFTSSTNVSAYLFNVPSSIGNGIHTIGIRSKEANNIWSHCNMFQSLVFTPQVVGVIDSIEYFIDTDPQFGSANAITGFASQANIQNFAFAIPSAGLNNGIHTVGVRTKNTNGSWSHADFVPFLVNDTTAPGVITAIEYFWDVDSGFYYYLPYVPSQSVSDLSNEIMNITVPLTISQGSHTLFLRSLDSHGKWSLVNYNPNITVSGYVGLNEVNNETGVNVFPNPFTDKFTVNVKENERKRVILYSENGQLVLDRIIAESTAINTADFAKGAYTLFVWADKSKIFRTTLIKQ